MSLLKRDGSPKMTSGEYPARRVAELGFFLALGLILHWVEGFFPPLLPGAKLGLANVVPFTLLLSGKPREAFFLNLLRILLGSFLGGNFLGVTFFMSLAGGLSAFLGMMLFLRGTTAPLWISVGGALCHNLGQWWVAFLYLRSWGLLWYLPVLLILSLPAGFLVGYLGMLLRNRGMEVIWKHWR
jgi:heptaprenyl diphosphate synthase